jgi:hypothetical protein
MCAEGDGVGIIVDSGVGSGVAEGVASGNSSGGIVSAAVVLGKIVSRFRRGSSGLGAGVGPVCSHIWWRLLGLTWGW